MTIDFNIHLPPDGDFKNELDFSRFDAEASWRDIQPRMKAAGIERGNVMMLDPGLMAGPNRGIVSSVTDAGSTATVGIDPRLPDAFELIDEAAAAGARGIKFHPLFLDLEDHDFDKAVACAARAEGHGLWVCVCCSYGTPNLFRISGIRLLMALILGGIKAPIIALHAGGRHVLDVMLASFDAPNVSLEISFSIPFYIGSTVEKDFLFAIERLGADRFLYASDHPHRPMEENLATVRSWLRDKGITDRDMDLIFHDNAKRLMDGA